MDEWHRGIKIQWSLSREITDYICLLDMQLCRMAGITVKSGSEIITMQSATCVTQWNNEERRASFSQLNCRSQRLKMLPVYVFIGLYVLTLHFTPFNRFKDLICGSVWELVTKLSTYKDNPNIAIHRVFLSMWFSKLCISS